MQRYLGFVPLVLLSIATIFGAALGLSLSHQASSGVVAEETGCRHIIRGSTATGVERAVCTYNGDRIIIWSFNHGLNTVEPVGWMRSGIEGPTWIVGCEQSEDCVAIHRRLGGQLLGSAWLGSSIDVQ